MTHLRLAAALMTAGLLALATGPTARAGLTGFDAFGNLEATQTANNTAPTGTPLAFFASRLFYDTPGDVTTALGTNTQSNQTFTYTPQAGNYALAQTGFITPDQLSGGYLTGGFNFNINGGNLAPRGGGANLGSPLFTSAVPYLTGNSYAQLQGLNAAQADTITFNGFTPVAGANESDIFLTITNSTTGAVVFSTSFFNNSSATSAFLAANTLAAGTSYNLELDYSSRLNSTGTFNGSATPFTAGYDTRTEVAFTTAPAAVVPEPASLALLAIGTASAALAARRRRPNASA